MSKMNRIELEKRPKTIEDIDGWEKHKEIIMSGVSIYDS